MWEILEWSSDELFGSNLSMGNDDTVGDLISDTLGSITGGLLLVAWTKYGWGSVRRIPGDSRSRGRGRVRGQIRYRLEARASVSPRTRSATR